MKIPANDRQGDVKHIKGETINFKESDMKAKFERVPGWRTFSLTWLMAVLLAAGIGLLAGCSSNPSAPDNDTIVQTSADPVALEFATLKRGNSEQCNHASGWVTPWSGGRISLGWGHPANRFVVRRGSVDKPVRVEIATCFVPAEDATSLRLIEFDFQPDGLEFNKPALLILNARSLERLQNRLGAISALKLYWLNPETGEWEVYQEAKVVNGNVIFEIEHFSKFGISSM